jgi:hypothetical protein
VSTMARAPRMRMTMVFTAPLLLVSTMSGCADSEPTQSRRVSYECTDAGQRDARALAVSLGAPSPTTKAFNHCQSRWQTAGVRVDPFLAEAKLGEAVASATERFNCGTPVHPPNMLPRTAASLECTIADVRVDVFLQDEGRGISANIHPRE